VAAQNEIDHVRQTVLEGHDPVLRAEAMRRLREAKPPDAHTVFETVLLKPSEDVRLRALAAFHVGRLQTPDAAAVVVRSIERIDQPTVLGALLRVAARIADASALPALDRVAAKSSGATARLARFAATLTAYRLNLPGHDLPFPTEDKLRAPAAGVPVLPIQIRPAASAEIRTAVASLANDPPGIPISTRMAWRIQCRGSEWMLFVHEGFAGPQALAHLTSSKSVPFVLAIRQREEGDHRPALFVLCRPSTDKRSLNLLLHAADGMLSYAGTGAVGDGQVRFTIRTVADAGLAPLRIDGSFDGSSLAITSALAAASAPARQPEPPRVQSLGAGRGN
jgi:hypothetical protein